MGHIARILILAAVLGASPVLAQDLRIGSRNEPAVDPHYLWLGTNTAYSKHIFEALILKDENNTLMPGLATGWRLLDDRLWEFKLRQGVTFHDGSPFTAEDVKFSYERVRNLPNNPGTYASNIAQIEAMEIVDPHTIRFKTYEPAATLPGLLGLVMIVSHTAAANASPADFRAGRAAIGTGPFKFVEFRPGEALRVARNESYWGQRPAWQNVTFRIIPNDHARVLALLAGDVDMAEHIAIPEAPRIESDPGFRLYKRMSDRSVVPVPGCRAGPRARGDRQGGRAAGRQPFPQRAGAPGDLHGDQSSAHCRAPDGRLRPARQPVGAGGADRLQPGAAGPGFRSGGGPQAAGRGRVSGRLRPGDHLHQRPRRQRQQDLRDARPDAVPHRADP